MSSSTDQSPRLRVHTQSTGLYLFRHRNYSPSLGTWTSQDPAGYVNGANTYQFVMSNPVGSVDPSGFHWWDSNWWWLIPPVGAGFSIGRYIASLESDAYYALQAQQSQVNWVKQAANPNAKPWQVPKSDACPQLREAYNAALRAGVRGGEIPEMPSGGPITLPGNTVGTNAAKGITIREVGLLDGNNDVYGHLVIVACGTS